VLLLCLGTFIKTVLFFQGMKALILAAGMGSRLMPYTEETPKCLLKVGEVPMLALQLKALHAIGIRDIVVVTGYLKEKVEEVVGDQGKCIFNPDFETHGILHSFLAAKEEVYGEEFLYLAGDIVYNAKIPSLIASGKGDIAIGVDRKPCNEEHSKVLVENGQVVEMAKTIVCGEATGEFAHIAKFSKEGSKAFFDVIEETLAEKDARAYMMDALNKVRDKGLVMLPVYTDGYARIEIDFIEDLEKARKMVFHETDAR